MAYATQHGVRHAILVVHEFRSTHTDPARIAMNQQDLDRFVDWISAGRWTRVTDGDLLGPLTIPGNRDLGEDVLLFLGKASRELA